MKNKKTKDFDMIEFVGLALDDIHQLSVAMNDTLSRTETKSKTKENK